MLFLLEEWMAVPNARWAVGLVNQRVSRNVR